MIGFIQEMGYMAHGYCLLWQPWLIALHGGSDLLIFLAYMAIPFAILKFRRLRPEVEADTLLVLFAAFIMLCGLTHLAGLTTLWAPIYGAEGALKAVTAAVSVATAAALFPLIPKLAALPSPAQMQATNARLVQEVEAHMVTLAELREARAELERKVAARTAELEAANARLQVLTGETVHRGKNLLSVVQSLARQTARSAPDTDSFIKGFEARLAALAGATDAVIAHGERGYGELGAVIGSQLAAYEAAYPGRVHVAGPALPVTQEAAQLLALAMHELITNAVKYGALAGPAGTVALDWAEVSGQEGPALRFDWRETVPGGLPDAPPERTGFGQRLLTVAVPGQLGGTVEHGLGPDGLRWSLTVPLERVMPERG